MSPDPFLHKKVGSGHKLLAQNLRHSQCLSFLHIAQILGQILYLEGKPIAVNLVAACVQLK